MADGVATADHCRQNPVCACVNVLVLEIDYKVVCLCVHVCQQEVLDIARDLLDEIQINPSVFGDSTELERKLKQTKAVLEMYELRYTCNIIQALNTICSTGMVISLALTARCSLSL